MADRRIVERYRLVTLLGAGGMGTVWRAHDELLGREVAIKRIEPAEDTPPEERAILYARAAREARAAAMLDHPGIITVHDVVEPDDQPWIIMELVEGRSLDQALDTDGPLPPRRVAEIGVRLLDALTAAHEKGLLHRDVKPANVLLAQDGRILLTDFGIAALEGDPALTRTGALVGSPGFIAPERLRDEPAGPASDLWSLGATLYAAVEGRPPFGQTAPLAALGATLAGEPPPPGRAGALASVLTHLLDKDPATRIGTAAAGTALRRVAAGDDSGLAAMPSPAQQSTGQRAAGNPTADRPTAGQPSTDRPAADQPTIDPPPADQAATDPRAARPEVHPATQPAGSAVARLVAWLRSHPPRRWAMVPIGGAVVAVTAAAVLLTRGHGAEPARSAARPVPHPVSSVDPCAVLTDGQANALLAGAVRQRDVPRAGDCSWLAPRVPAMLTVYKPVAVAASFGAGSDRMAIERNELLALVQQDRTSPLNITWTWPYAGFPRISVHQAATTALVALPGVGDEAVTYTYRGSIPYDEVQVTLREGNVILELQCSGRRTGPYAAVDRVRRAAVAVAETLARQENRG